MGFSFEGIYCYEYAAMPGSKTEVGLQLRGLPEPVLIMWWHGLMYTFELGHTLPLQDWASKPLTQPMSQKGFAAAFLWLERRGQAQANAA